MLFVFKCIQILFCCSSDSPGLEWDSVTDENPLASKADLMLTNEVEHFWGSVRAVFVWYYPFVGQGSPPQCLEVFLAQQRTEFHIAGTSGMSPIKLSFHLRRINTTQPLLHPSPEEKQQRNDSSAWAQSQSSSRMLPFLLSEVLIILCCIIQVSIEYLDWKSQSLFL